MINFTLFLEWLTGLISIVFEEKFNNESVDYEIV